MALPKTYLDELNELNREVQRQQPVDVLQFCADYFNRRVQERGSSQESSTDSENQAFCGFKKLSFGGIQADDPHHPDPAGHDDETVSSVKEGSQDHQDFLLNFNKYRRTSVSAERLDPAKEKLDKTSNPGLYLSNEKRRLLDSSVAKNFIFNNMDEDSIESVLGALQEKSIPNGTEIITQGDVGDYFYIIESGSVDFYKDGAKVNSAASGSSFGELALLHNAPRAATVIATSDCKLWALDRVSFRKIVLANTASKRNMYGEFLREVPILKPLSDGELLRLSDALGSCIYQAGEVIVREGEPGEDFFMIEYGTAEVTKEGQGKLADLSKGDYFGEVALLHGKPRQATVTATSKTKVMTLEKNGFKRLLGNKVLDTLKKQDPTTNRN